MTKQEYYDLLVLSSVDGTFPSWGWGSIGCLYRSPNGTKCAIGVLIPYEEYELRMEGGACRLFYEFPQLHKYIPIGMTVMDLKTVQRIHDGFKSTYGKWKASRFVEALNIISFFNDVKKVTMSDDGLITTANQDKQTSLSKRTYSKTSDSRKESIRRSRRKLSA